MRSRKRSRARLLRGLVSLLLAVVLLMCAAVVYVKWIKPEVMRRHYVLRYDALIAENAVRCALDPYLLAAMIFCESHYDPQAVSAVGARGLMQLMPDTADWLAWRMELDGFEYDMLFDPQTNIAMGSAYLSFLKARYDGNVSCMVAAYHAGHGQTDKWLKDPACSYDGKTLYALPENETKQYLKWVLNVYEVYLELYPDAFEPADQGSGRDGLSGAVMRLRGADALRIA